MISRRVGVWAVMAMAWSIVGASAAHAQDDPPGPFVIDARVPFVSFERNDAIATPLGLRSDQLPRRGLGLEIGGHVYPLRGRHITLGLGATFLRARGEQAPGEDSVPGDPTIETRFTALTPQVSLNFGSGRGWSYIGGGYGLSRRTSGDVSGDLPDGPNVGTLNYGGGARWFVARHIALSFDVRFYRVGTQEADEANDVPESPSHTMFVGSVGVGFK